MITALVGVFGLILIFAIIQVKDDRVGSAASDIHNQFSVEGVDGVLRTYSEIDLGLPGAIRSQLEELHPWTRFATPEERLEIVDAELEQFYSLRGHERERRFFEIQLQTVITDGLESLSGELSTYDGLLALAFREGMQQCAVEHDIAGDAHVFSLLDFQKDHSIFEEEQSMTYDELVALRHSCATAASEYPTLTEPIRVDLLERQYDALREYVYQWVRDNPELIVPVEYHAGINQPYAEALIESCKQTDDPAICADEAGVNVDNVIAGLD